MCLKGHSSCLNLHLCCPSRIVVEAHRDRMRRPNEEDWVREMTNQLAGKMNRRLRESQTALSIALPKTLHIAAMQQQFNRATRLRFYQFRTRWGSMLLAVEGALDGLMVRYGGERDSPTQDDVILFGDGN